MLVKIILHYPQINIVSLEEKMFALNSCKYI